MTMTTPAKSHLVRQLKADIRQITGKDYRIAFDEFDELSIREMARLLIDLKYEHQRAVNNERMKARRMPWLVR